MKYKIVETLYSFKVFGWLPTIKKRRVRVWLFFFYEESYEDYNEMDWHVLNMYGNRPQNHIRIGYIDPIANFKTFKEAEEFIQKLKRGDIETIIE